MTLLDSRLLVAPILAAAMLVASAAVPVHATPADQGVPGSLPAPPAAQPLAPPAVQTPAAPAAQTPAPVAAPAPVAPARPPVTQAGVERLRYQMNVLEGVLENAVQHGAQVVNTQIREFSPDVMLFSGPARARGYRLDGYGVFFSVEVPRVRGSMAWSVRTLTQNNRELRRAVDQLRRFVEATPATDQRVRRDIEAALRLVELQAGPLPRTAARDRRTAAGTAPGAAAGAGSTVTPASTGGAAPVVAAESIETDLAFEPPAILTEPDAVYEAEVKRALIDAMLDHGTPLDLEPGEWLTVAAREHEDSLLTGEIVTSVTITLRLRARDLAEFKAGRLSRDEARARVEVSEF